MNDVMQWLSDSAPWLFSGIGVVIIGLICKKLFHKSTPQINQSISSGEKSTNIQSGRDVIIGNNKDSKDK